MGKKDTFLCEGFSVLRQVPLRTPFHRGQAHPLGGSTMFTGDKCPRWTQLRDVRQVDRALSDPVILQVISQVLFTNSAKMDVGTVWNRRLWKRQEQAVPPCHHPLRDSGQSVCVRVGLAAVLGTPRSSPSLSLFSPLGAPELQPCLFPVVSLLPLGKMPTAVCRTLVVLFACSRGLC